MTGWNRHDVFAELAKERQREIVKSELELVELRKKLREAEFRILELERQADAVEFGYASKSMELDDDARRDQEQLLDLAQSVGLPVMYVVGIGRIVKVGYSGRPASRIKELQTGFPFDLQLLGIKTGGNEAEADFHERWAAQKLRRRGEWFYLSESAILEFKDTLATTPLEYYRMVAASGAVWPNSVSKPEGHADVDKLLTAIKSSQNAGCGCNDTT